MFKHEGGHAALSERKAAKFIEDSIKKQFPLFEDDPNQEIKFIYEVVLNKSVIESTDFLMIGRFNNPLEVKFSYPISFTDNQTKERHAFKKATIENFIAVVEVKNHTGTALRMNANSNDLEVKTSGSWKSTTEQNKKQMHAYQNQIVERSKKNHNPFITRFTLLSNQSKKDSLEFADHEFIRFYDNTAEEFLWAICQRLLSSRGRMPKKSNDSAVMYSAPPRTIDYCYDGAWIPSFTDISKLDQKKMNVIASKLRYSWWVDDVGKRMVEFRGLGGTGKTVKLLQIAHDLFKESQADVLFLTYNHALVIGVNRTMQQMDIPLYRINERSGGIVAQSCMSFFWNILSSFGYISEEDQLEIKKNKSSLEPIYERATNEFAELLDAVNKDQNMSREDLLNELDPTKENQYALIHNIVLVDECQDWLPTEIEILTHLFGYKNIVLSHGIKQNIRGEEITWGRELTKSNKREADCQKRFHRLKQGVRMTNKLGNFAKAFSYQNLRGDDYKDLESNEENRAGKIYVIEGNYFTHPIRHQIIAQLKKEKIENLDLIHIIPPGRKISDFVELDKNNIWDGTDEEGRKCNPHSLQDIRFVKYPSCRGLEGWIAFNHYLDEYWEYLLAEGKKYYENKIQGSELGGLDSSNDYATNFAAQAILIAFTRGIDEIVISLKDVDSEIGKKLKLLSDANPGSIEWVLR
jgi:hypothetical protein